MTVNFLAGVFLPVSNLERSVDFYTKELGLRCRGIERWGESRAATLFTHPDKDDYGMLCLEETAGKIVPAPKPFFNLNVSGVEALHKSLHNRFIRVSDLEVWDSPWNTHMMFDVYDPDGHPINLVEWAPKEIC